MNIALSSMMLASGAILASRVNCQTTRIGGVGLMAAALLMSPVPVLAQQHILAVDNGEVRCEASKSDLTRIALKDDQFVSVSRVQSGIESEDFAIVHEPTRGDIYLSVPEAYAKPNISFFGTTQRGYVYKFDCEVAGEGALQVFVANADVENPPMASQALALAEPLDDRAVGLVRAMFEQRTVAGFEIRDEARAPVNVGDLKVQLVSEYRSPSMTGKVLRIENTGNGPVSLSEELIAGDGAIAVAISNPELATGQATAAYVVVPSGR